MLVTSLGSRYSSLSLIPAPTLTRRFLTASVQMSQWDSPKAQPIPCCSLLEGVLIVGPRALGTPGQPDFLFLQPTPLPLTSSLLPAPQGRSLTCRGPSRVPVGLMVPQGAEAGERLSGGISLPRGPSEPLQPAASAQPSCVPVAEVY